MTREALRALLAAGTPGPWSKPFDDGALTANGVDSLLGLDVDGMAIVDRPEDAALIAAAVNALPALLDALDAAERLRASAAADEETMRGLYDDVEQARGQVERLRADITAARDIAAVRGGVPGRGYAESAVDTATWLVEALEEARADLAETRLRLAIWSGEGVPEGWTAAADGEPYIERDLGDLTAEVYADGRWLIWRDLRDDLAPGVVVEDHPGPRETTEALRAAEAWLREREVDRG